MDQKPEPQFQETMSDQCNACGSLKKKDPTTSEDASGDGQPQLKKRETASVHDYRLHGFSRVAVPPPNFYTNLSRTSSNLINSPGLDLPKLPSWQNFPHSPLTPRMNPNVSTLSPSPVKGGSTELPPLPPLRRSISELLPVASPPRTGVSGHGEMVTGSPVVSQDSPDPERFKRMMEMMKEMKQWWHEVVLEVEDAGSHHNNTNEASNAETEDLVIIERMGDFISIYLKCPCSKTYQLLISGSNCFYRLM
ncbi:uncharacterized protein LOC132252666 [Vitis vinifera]|uniref:Uncharacterized protein n=1 Tax=Vitis vinifera TaxID=29760 RepID=A0A438IF43_VITVI|nr:uncharacterized protein LOC132252666 [Vitis vinifera]RVW95370.1 hypothetical protein CK203_028732 [Vitis vinifera]